MKSAMLTDEILRGFDGLNVLITGGTGMIGRQVVDILSRTGANIRIVSLDDLRVSDTAEHITGDLTGLDFCREVTAGMDYVFHLAGVQGSVGTVTKKLASHFVPTLMMSVNLLEACRLNKVKKTVYTSSIGAYAEGEFLREADYRVDSAPMVFAGWAKRMAELQIHAYKVQYGLENFSVVRPANVYGPGDNFDPASALVVAALIYRIHRGERPLVVWGDGLAVRDFVFCRDVAEGIILALHHGTKGEIVNLGSGTGYSIRELVETLRGFIDFEYRFDTTKPSGFPKRVLDITRARETLGYDPQTSLADGLRQTWDWFVSHAQEHEKKMSYYRGGE